jgi:hypothetical protein
MKEKKKKEESTSSETPREKIPFRQGPFIGHDRVHAEARKPHERHRVATRYFESFRRERNIPEEEPASGLWERP